MGESIKQTTSNTKMFKSATLALLIAAASALSLGEEVTHSTPECNDETRALVASSADDAAILAQVTATQFYNPGDPDFGANRFWYATDSELLYMANWTYYKTRPMYNWPNTSYPQGPSTQRWQMVGQCHWEYRNCDYYNANIVPDPAYAAFGLREINCVAAWHDCWDDIDDF